MQQIFINFYYDYELLMRIENMELLYFYRLVIKKPKIYSVAVAFGCSPKMVMMIKINVQ